MVVPLPRCVEMVGTCVGGGAVIGLRRGRQRTGEPNTGTTTATKRARPARECDTQWAVVGLALLSPLRALRGMVPPAREARPCARGGGPGPPQSRKSRLRARDELASLDWVVRHSITSSARPSSVIGNTSPSALAVFMLMISSTRVACCTGRSAGLSPLRIRPV
jgi:hypothetical protein